MKNGMAKARAKLEKMAESKDKGFAFGMLQTAAIGLVIFVIVLFVGATIGAEFQKQATTNASYNVTEKGVAELVDMADWLDIIVIVVIAAVILMLVMGALGGMGRGKR